MEKDWGLLNEESECWKAILARIDEVSSCGGQRVVVYKRKWKEVTWEGIELVASEEGFIVESTPVKFIVSWPLISIGETTEEDPF